jgi:membrane protease YdiL (CAAX protease family)
MVDLITSADTCRVCGALLNKDQFQGDGLCSACAEAGAPQTSGDAQSGLVSPPSYDFSPPARQENPPDPDNPPWGPVTGVSVWLISFAAIIVVPVIAVGVWLLIESARGAPLPNFAIKEEIEQWLTSPPVLLVQVISTIVAHAITLAMCWAVATRVGSRPFWASLGWGWGGRPIWYWVIFSAGILVAVQVASQILSRFLPEAKSPFAQMLATSQQVRIAVAVLATFTAPVVEEVVYRGFLFSSLRKRIGLIATVTVVTATFAGVHVFQNRGAWVSIAGLTLLSLALTLVRARTKSVLPCVFIHTLNNAFASVFIVLNKAS